MRILNPELSAVTDATATIVFATATDDGVPICAETEIRVAAADAGPVRTAHSPAESCEPSTGVRLVEVTDLTPGTLYEADIVIGNAHAEHDRMFFPSQFRTLQRPRGELLATVATVSDMHFGEEICGKGPRGDEAPVFRATDEDPPYWHYMNHAILAEINAAGVDRVLVKGDITGSGRAEEFALAREALDRLEAPWAAVLGNHDRMHESVDGLALLGRDYREAQTVGVPGCWLVLVDTVAPGHDGGALPPGGLEALEAELSDTGGEPALAFGHHYTGDPRKHSDSSFGVRRDDSKRLLDLFALYPNLGGYFAGHTHRNRVRYFPETGGLPHAEVCATKDYPGAWALYRIYEAGYMQEVRRCRAHEALRWADLTKGMYFGWYRAYALGRLDERCFTCLWNRPPARCRPQQPAHRL